MATRRDPKDWRPRLRAKTRPSGRDWSEWTYAKGVLRNSSRLAWWDGLQRVKKDAGEDEFREWIRDELHDPHVMNIVLDEMAWNDHNSEWFLRWREVVDEGTVDGEPITVPMVTESLMSMLE